MKLKIAHRGASAYEPENTLLAFRKAIEMGANAIEFDVHSCKTGEIVVIHDSTLERTTNGMGEVKTNSLKDLQKLDAGKGERIPTLKEVLLAIPRNITLFIELKEEGLGDELNKVISEAVKDGWDANNLIVISFAIDELAKIKRKFPEIQIGLTFDRLNRDKVEEVCNHLQPVSINLCIKYLVKQDVDFCHKKGCKVFVWTANNKEEVVKAYHLGADAVMSDYPDLL